MHLTPVVGDPNSSFSSGLTTSYHAFNHSGVSKIFEEIARKFDKMYCTRAFVHWYVGIGVSEGFFEEARENLAAVIHEYWDAIDEGECDE